MMKALTDVVVRVDADLYDHVVEEEGVDLGQAVFQWLHCLLTRELPPRLVIRLWDTYLAYGSQFRKLHVYVCAALLIDVGAHLRRPATMDKIMTRLKFPKDAVEMANLTMEWMDGLIASAYVLSVQHAACTVSILRPQIVKQLHLCINQFK